MNPSGSSDGHGRFDRNGPGERRNRWHDDPVLPLRMGPRDFRNEGLYGHQPNAFWPGHWMIHHYHKPSPTHNGHHPRAMPQQVFKQHQPFGNAGHQAQADAFPFPPPAHIPRNFYFGTQRGNGRRPNHRQSSRQLPQNAIVAGGGAAAGTHHIDNPRRHGISDVRPKNGNGSKRRRKHHWKKRANYSNVPIKSKADEKMLNECSHEETVTGEEDGIICVLCGNGNHCDSENLFSSHDVADNPSSVRDGEEKGILLNIRSEDGRENSSINNDLGFANVNFDLNCKDDPSEATLEEGAVGGIDLSPRAYNIYDSSYCPTDKDLIDEGAICDLDGIFQNQECVKDDDKGSLCNSEEECSGSRDSESENGAYGGLPPSIQSTVHSSFSNKVSSENVGDNVLQLRCYDEGGSLTASRLSAYENNGKWMKNGQCVSQNGGSFHRILSNDNACDSGGEDNGDFIDADLPSCNKHILSSSDEMENLSSDDGSEREGRVGQQSIPAHLLDFERANLNCNDLSTLHQKVLNGFEQLSLRGENPLKENGMSSEKHFVHNEPPSNPNSDSQSKNKKLFYSKQARYLSDNSDSECENCDIPYASERASRPSQTSHISHSQYPTAITHSPVIGAAACALSHCEKDSSLGHPGADGESISSGSQTQCFHLDVSSGGVSNLPPSKSRDQRQQYIDNLALSASSEQWAPPFHHLALSASQDPASGPSFGEGSACYSQEHYLNPMNNLNALYHSNGHSANGFNDDAGANFIHDESNQHQKVFMKKSLEGKADASYSASSTDNRDMGVGGRFPDMNVGEAGNQCAEELLTPDSGDSVDMVLLPMEEEIEPVHFMAGLCPSGGSFSGDEDEGSQSPNVLPSTSLSNNNVQAVSSALSCDDCHCTCKDLTPKLINRLPSKEFYELIKSVSASDSCMRFFDKDGKDVQRSNLTAQSDDDSVEQYNRPNGSKADRLKVDRVMIWNEYEAYVVQYKQIAVSACGQTAVLNVMKALKFNCDKAAVCKVIKTSLRKEDKDIPEYLFSRACAGTTLTELKDGVAKLSGGTVGGRFFNFWPPRKVKLLHWLAFWMKKGAIPMAAMNLQQGPHSIWEVPDSWHHQMVYGVSDQGLYLTNPLEIVSERSAMKQLCSDSVLLVRRQDIVSRFHETTDLSQLLNHPDPRWMSMNVLGQVVNVLRECNMPSVPGYRLQVTSHVCIPASYQAGIMLFMRKDKSAWNSLMAAPDLPLEDITTSNS